jgi:hypothetical protein
MHDTLDAGAVQCNERMGTDRAFEQVSHAEQITGAFFSHCRGEQDWSLGFHPRSNERFADRDERSQTARVVGDARPLEPRPAA